MALSPKLKQPKSIAMDHFVISMSVVRGISTLLLALLSVVPGSVMAKDIVLYAAPGVQVAHYQIRVDSIKVGDELIFSGGKCFHVYGFLGHGGSQNIYDIGEGLALQY